MPPRYKNPLWFLQERTKTARILTLRYNNPEMSLEEISRKVGVSLNFANVTISGWRAKGLPIPKKPRVWTAKTRLDSNLALALRLRWYFPRMSAEGIAKILGTSISNVRIIFREAQKKGYSVIPFALREHLDLRTLKSKVLQLRWKRPHLTTREIADLLGAKVHDVSQVFLRAARKGYPLPDLNAEIGKLKALKKDLQEKRELFPSKAKVMRDLIDAIDGRIARLEKKKKSKRWVKIEKLTMQAQNERAVQEKTGSEDS